MTTRLDMAVAQLGKYFGTVSKSSFMNLLLSTESIKDINADDLKIEETPEKKIGDVFLNVTEGGLRIPKIISELQEMGIPKKESDALLAITYEEGQGNGAEDWINKPDEKSIPGDAHLPGQGVRTNDTGKTFSIKKMITVDESKSPTEINSKPGSPDKSASSLSVIQIFPVKLTPAGRDTGAIGVFMNAIPTLEMSRCVPYVDITLITPRQAVAEDGRIQTMSLSQFLMGQSKVEEGSIDHTLATALDAGALAEGYGEDDEETKDKDESHMATAGMELFCSPQTLVPGDEMHIEDVEAYAFTDAGGSVEGSTGGKRAAPIIDRFRPFLTLKSLNFNVTPTTGMMSHKSAKMSLTLHDRSRLSEVAEFVKPDLLGGNELLIEYGWSHPTGGYESKDSGWAGDNAFGIFLNSLRCVEKYKTVNSSYSFDEVGQVEIDLDLSMVGVVNLDTTKISKGEGVDEQMETLTKLTKAVSVARRSMMGKMSKSERADMGGGSALSAGSSTSRALTVPTDTQKEIKKFLKQNRNKKKAPPEVKEMVKNLEALYGKSGDGKKGLVAEIKKSIAEAVKDKVRTLYFTEDPFLVSMNYKFVKIDKYGTKRRNARRRTHVSLGKLITTFVGKPLASSGKFDDVQILFYAFNAKAGYVKDMNIAQFPINIEDFEKAFKEAAKTTANLPLRRFLGFVGRNFINAPHAEAFGMAALYKENKKEKKKEMIEKYKKGTALFNAKQQRLEDAYGTGEDLKFKMPRIGMIVECVKAQKSDKDKNAAGPKAQTILRLHFFDKQATKYEAIGKLLEASNNTSIGTLSGAASKARRKDPKDATKDAKHAAAFIEIFKEALKQGLIVAVPDESGSTAKGGSFDLNQLEKAHYRLDGGFPKLKKFIASTMPTIVYGTQNSAVISANLSSMDNPQLATVNMLRTGGGGTTAAGARDSGVPLRVAPNELTIDTFGCPLMNFGQQFFVDFGTGTTVDNVYTVTGIDHDFSPGEFKTSVKLTQLDAYGKYESMIDTVQKALTALSTAKE